MSDPLDFFQVKRDPGEEAVEEGECMMLDGQGPSLCAYCGTGFYPEEVVDYIRRENGRVDYYHQHYYLKDDDYCVRMAGK